MKINVSNDHCKGCLWIDRNNVCSFRRCVRYFGWVADKRRGRIDGQERN